MTQLWGREEETRGNKQLVFFQLIFSRYFGSEKVIIGVFSPLLRLVQSSVTLQNTWRWYSKVTWMLLLVHFEVFTCIWTTLWNGSWKHAYGNNGPVRPVSITLIELVRFCSSHYLAHTSHVYVFRLLPHTSGYATITEGCETIIEAPHCKREYSECFNAVFHSL